MLGGPETSVTNVRNEIQEQVGSKAGDTDETSDADG